MNNPKHAVISSFLSNTKDRFHEYNTPLTLDEKLDMITELHGFNGIEAVYPYEVDNPTTLKKSLIKRNLHIAAINANIKADPIFRNGSLTNPSQIVRDKAVKMIKEAKDFAELAGADKVTCCPLGDGYEFNFQTDYLEAFSHIIETLTEAATYKSHMPLFIEYKPSETRGSCFLNSAAKTVSLLNQITAPPKSLGITLDFGHSIYGGMNPTEDLCLIHQAGYPVYIHINDNNGKWDWDFMAGTHHYIQYVEFLYYLNKLGYNDYITSDTSPTRWNIKESFEINARITNKIWNLIKAWNIDHLLSGDQFIEIQKFLEKNLYQL